jgi:hypothetical protein
VIDQPSAIVAGVSFSPEVRLELLDAYSNRVTGNNSFGIRPVFVKSDSTTSTSATITASAGVIAFQNLTFTEAGSYRIRFEDAASNLTSVTSSEFVVSAAAAHSLVWDEQPINVIARTVMTQSPRLKVIDRFGNHVTSDSTTNVQLRVLPQSGNTAVTPASATGLLKQAAAGYVTFDNISLGLTAATYRLQVAAATNSGVALAGSTSTPTSGFELMPGAPYALSIATTAADARAGASFGTQPVINILDRDNNIVPTTSNIVMSVNQIQTTGSVSVAAVNGVATFTNAGVSGARGNYLVTYTLTVGGNTITTTQPIVLASGVAAKIEIVDQPVDKKTGSSFSAVAPRIRLLDAFDNPVTISGSITARATVVSSTSTPLNTNTQSAAVSFDSNGIASFQGFDFVATPGTYRLAFAGSNFAVVTSSMFVVNVSDPAILTWQTPPPSTLVTGINMPTAVLELRDAFGNLVASDNSTVVTLSSANGTTLSGVTAVAQGGRFTFTNFNMIAIPGNYTLTASASVGTISISQAITITNDVAAKLQVEVSGLQTPRAGQPLQYSAGGYLRVKVLDRFDNLVVTGADTSLRITLSATAVAVSGSLGVTATGGIANFSSSSIVLSGTATNTGYSLLFSSNATRGALVTGRQTFLLSAGSPSKVQITTAPPSSAQTGVSFSPGAIAVVDAWDNQVDTASNVVLQLWRSSSTLSSTVVAVSNGAHTLSTVSYVATPNTGYRLRYFVQGNEAEAVLSSTFRMFSGDPFKLSVTEQPVGDGRSEDGFVVVGGSTTVTETFTGAQLNSSIQFSLSSARRGPTVKPVDGGLR